VSIVFNLVLFLLTAGDDIKGQPSLLDLDCCTADKGECEDDGYEVDGATHAYVLELIFNIQNDIP